AQLAETRLLLRHRNPLDVVFDSLRLETRADIKEWIPFPQLMQRVHAAGLTPQMLQKGYRQLV
ncbi:MAG: hypothetical protein ACKPKO_61480, partial [Candidatus Fonsibacter sp.]